MLFLGYLSDRARFTPTKKDDEVRFEKKHALGQLELFSYEQGFEVRLKYESHLRFYEGEEYNILVVGDRIVGIAPEPTPIPDEVEDYFVSDPETDPQPSAEEIEKQLERNHQNALLEEDVEEVATNIYYSVRQTGYYT